MTLEAIYNELNDIIKNDMNFVKALKLKEKLEEEIRKQTCYKTTRKTRVNAIKKVASKREDRPVLTGYGICNDYKCVTDSYHAIMIFEENMPLKLVTTDNELADKMGHDNCINGVYPNFEHFINFDKNLYNITTLDLDDIMQYYKLHKKNAQEEPYTIENVKCNIIFLKNVIDVLGTNITVYTPREDCRPIYIVNEKNEIGLVLPIKTY